MPPIQPIASYRVLLPSLFENFKDTSWGSSDTYFEAIRTLTIQPEILREKATVFLEGALQIDQIILPDLLLAL